MCEKWMDDKYTETMCAIFFNLLKLKFRKKNLYETFLK